MEERKKGRKIKTERKKKKNYDRKKEKEKRWKGIDRKNLGHTHNFFENIFIKYT